MKETLLELLNDWWVIFWFVMGMVFIILGVISAINKENDKALACFGISLACHARCEVRILTLKFAKRN